MADRPRQPIPPIGADGNAIAEWMCGLSDEEANRVAFALCALLWLRAGAQAPEKMSWRAPSLGLEVEVSFIADEQGLRYRQAQRLDQG